MITTSFLGSFRAIGPLSALVDVPIRPSHDADGRKRIALVMAVDPVAIIVARAWKADHAPGAHVAIAAVDRIGEKTLLRVLQQQFEERLARRRRRVSRRRSPGRR